MGGFAFENGREVRTSGCVYILWMLMGGRLGAALVATSAPALHSRLRVLHGSSPACLQVVEWITFVLGRPADGGCLGGRVFGWACGHASSGWCPSVPSANLHALRIPPPTLHNLLLPCPTCTSPRPSSPPYSCCRPGGTRADPCGTANERGGGGGQPHGPPARSSAAGQAGGAPSRSASGSRRAGAGGGQGGQRGGRWWRPCWQPLFCRSGRQGAAGAQLPTAAPGGAGRGAGGGRGGFRLIPQPAAVAMCRWRLQRQQQASLAWACAAPPAG